MALQLLAANNAQSVLAAGISASATSLTLNTGTGALFPSPVSGTSFFKLTLIDAATGQLNEIVHVTAKSGDVLTIVRGQEGTSARAWSANDIAANMLTAGTILLLAQLESPSFTGTPAGPTPAPGTNTTQLATTAFVRAAITALSLGTASTRNVGNGGFGTPTPQIPDMSFFPNSYGSGTGWFKLPGGDIIQFGSTNLSGGVSGTRINLPIPFPSSGYSISLTYRNGSQVTTNVPILMGDFVSNSAVNVYTNLTTGTYGIFWVAMGS